jgi:glutamyl-tRNA reductase
MGNRPSIDSTREEELYRALRLLRRGEDPARIIDELSRRLTNKLIHAPTKALHEALSLLRTF